MKYIIVTSHDIECAILFDEILSHTFVADDRKVISAGMCNQLGEAYGQSVTLKIKSRPEDTVIIKKSMDRHI